VRSAATVGCSTTVRSAAMRRSTAVMFATAARSTVGFSAVRSAVATIIVAREHNDRARPQSRRAVVAASALTMEAMLAPAVAIAPAGPGPMPRKMPL